MAHPPTPGVLRSALFVDFDNIYIGLRRSDPEAARRFAEVPQRWLEWLEAQPMAGEPDARRRILARRCYLNPQTFNDFRPYFIRSAFEVIDCPPLTQQGKTSADVRIVLDVVDALDHPTRYDEFIVFSGDADFTPVLLRLRKHDRRTTVLTVGPSSAAYRAASDLLIAEETFIEQALGVSGEARREGAPPPRGAGAQRAEASLLAAIARRVHEQAAVTGVLHAWDLPAIYKQFPEFTRGESWLGYYSLRGLTEAVVATHGELSIAEDEDWWVETRSAAHAETDRHDGEDEAEPLSAAERSAVAALVREHVAGSDAPLSLAGLAQRVGAELGERVRAGRWQGAGTFKAFLDTLDLGNLRMTDESPGYAYDPGRHGDVAAGERRDEFAERHPDLAPLARTVADVTDTPYLSPEGYAVLLARTAAEVDANGFHLTRTSKAVRDACYAQGISLARAHVSFVLKGLLYGGYEFQRGEESAARLGAKLAENTIQLARRAQMDLSPDDEQRVRRWIVGGLGGGAA